MQSWAKVVALASMLGIASNASVHAGDDAHSRVAEDLAKENGPRSLALAASLRAQDAYLEHMGVTSGDAPDTREFGDAVTARWRRLAEEKQPGMDPIANVLLAVAAARAGDPPQQRAAAQRWKNAEPDNLAPILLSGEGSQAVLEAARTRHRFDMHFFEQMRWVVKEIEAERLARPRQRRS